MNKIFIFIMLLFVLGCTEKNEDQENIQLDQEIAKAKLSEIKSFLFVGNFSGLPSIYKYDITTGKSKIFWRHDDEKVLDLLISGDRKSAYFITKKTQRLKSSQPAIEKGQLYRIDIESNKVDLINQLDEGIQIICFWTVDDRFTLIINSIDKTIASYINKNTQIYNKFGKLLSDKNEIFDITKDGYPVTKFPELKYISPNGMFTILEKNDSVQIKQIKTAKLIKTRFVHKEIKQIGWAENNKDIILLVSDKIGNKSSSPNPIKSLLVIFDLQKKKTVKIFDGVGYKHFALIGDLLIFDEGFGKDSFIRLIKISLLEDYKTIKIIGGCGLRNISGI